MSGLHWLASYPKSGNTWLRMFIANLLADGDRAVDINASKMAPIVSDRATLDRVLGFSTADLLAEEVDRLRPAFHRWIAAAPAAESPLILKVHDAWLAIDADEPLMGSGEAFAAVYIVRNPLAVAPSLALHLGLDLDTAIAAMADPDFALARGGPGLSSQVRQRLLTWSSHVLSWVDAPMARRLVIRYEDMLADPAGSLGRAAEFLGLPADAARVRRAVEHSDFSELSRQESADGFRERLNSKTPFFRRGGSGHWREELTLEQADRIVGDHGAVMARFGYLDAQGRPY